MIVPSVLSSRFEEWKPFILDALKRVEETLVPYARRQGYIFDGRVKTLESLAEKLESGRYNGWPQIEDLYACTIAIPLPDEESNVREFLIEKFDLISSRERGRTAKQPEVFRFDSTRLILRTRKPEIAPREEDPSVFSVSFEVQIKSLYDYAWAKTTHALTYKSNTVEWKRYRLAAHLKAASEQIEFLLRGFDGASQYLVESPWASIRDKKRIGSFFKNSVENGVIPIEVAPKDWSRFSDNIYRGLQALEGHAPTSGGGRELGILEHVIFPHRIGPPLGYGKRRTDDGKEALQA